METKRYYNVMKDEFDYDRDEFYDDLEDAIDAAESYGEDSYIEVIEESDEGICVVDIIEQEDFEWVI